MRSDSAARVPHGSFNWKEGEKEGWKKVRKEARKKGEGRMEARR